MASKVVWWSILNLANPSVTFSVSSDHRCTRVEHPGEEVRQVFAKIPQGGQEFQEKLPGGSPYFGFIAFLLISLLKFDWGGGGSYLYPPPSTPPLCIYDLDNFGTSQTWVSWSVWQFQIWFRGSLEQLFWQSSVVIIDRNVNLKRNRNTEILV